MNKPKIHKYDAFDPRAYLNHYYVRMGEENKQILSFLYKVLKHDGRHFENALDFGCGPTIYPGLLIEPWTNKIYFSDYLKGNREEVEWWLSGHESKFSWEIFTEYTLKLEHPSELVTSKQIKNREDNLRKKTIGVMDGDVFLTDPMGEAHRGHFDLLISNFVIDSVTDSQITWKKLLRNLVSMIKPGGRLVLSSITGASHYKIGSKHFIAVHIDPDTIRNELFSLGFEKNSVLDVAIDAEVKDRYHESYEGYDGMYFISSKLSPIVTK